jgi:molybdopterin molybdotransferase
VIPYSEALECVLAEARPLPRESVPLDRAWGRHAAGEIRSPGAIPPFPNSAMDGFALAVGPQGLPAGTEMPVVGRVVAGDGPPPVASPDRGPAQAPEGAWEIMTGAPVPPGMDTVVPVERVEVRERDGRATSIRLLDPEPPGRNIRPAGADFASGDPVITAGRPIGPLEGMALSALGIPRIPVLEIPGAAVLSTGPELVDDPELPLPPGGIRNSNGPFLAGALEREGVRVVLRRTLGDEEGPFLEAMEEAMGRGAHLVISTGAVSMGKHDFVPDALERMGARLLFHRAAIRPGKPILAAVLPGGALHFGLPGNPISATVGFRFFVLPWLRRLRGLPPEPVVRLPLAETRGKPGLLRQFVKARVEAGESGGLRVVVLPGQESFRIAPMLRATCWAVLPEGTDRVEAGTPVEVTGLLGPLFPG